MNIPLECKYLIPEDCLAFPASCIKIKSGKRINKCQRKLGGLDLDREIVFKYLEKKKKGTVKEFINTHTKKTNLKVNTEDSDNNKFTSITKIISYIERGIDINKILIDFKIGEEQILHTEGYIKKMDPEKVILGKKMYNDSYNDNSRYTEGRNYSKDPSALHIKWVGTDEKYAGNRLGMYAIYFIEQICIKNFNIEYITLEDDTDVNPPKNLYYKLNFDLLVKGKNTNGQYDMWNDWHEWYAKNQKTSPENERMVSIKKFESSPEIAAVRDMYSAD
jgi:hypothetical protein